MTAEYPWAAFMPSGWWNTNQRTTPPRAVTPPTNEQPVCRACYLVLKKLTSCEALHQKPTTEVETCRSCGCVTESGLRARVGE